MSTEKLFFLIFMACMIGGGAFGDLHMLGAMISSYCMAGIAIVISFFSARHNT